MPEFDEHARAAARSTGHLTAATRRNWMGWVVGIGAAVVGGWWSSSRFKTTADTASAPGTLSVGQMVGDDFWALGFEQVEGPRLPMAGFQGQPLLINFWATWCPPCVKELPQIARFYEEFKDRRWKVLGLAIDGPSQVREFLARQPLGFSIALGGATGSDLARLLGNSAGALPFSVIIDPRGQLAWRKLGETSHEELAAVAGRISGA